MAPWEIFLSESQERMLLVVEPPSGAGGGGPGAPLRPGLRLRGGDRRGRPVPGLPPRRPGGGPAHLPAGRGTPPLADWEAQVPRDLSLRQTLSLEDRPDVTSSAGALEDLFGDPNLGDFTWIHEQYDSMVQLNTVLGAGTPGGGAAHQGIPASGGPLHGGPPLVLRPGPPGRSGGGDRLLPALPLGGGGPSPGAHQLPELPLPGGAGTVLGALRGGARHGLGLRGAGVPRGVRKREPLQRERLRPDPPHAPDGGGGSGGGRGEPPVPLGWKARGPGGPGGPRRLPGGEPLRTTDLRPPGTPLPVRSGAGAGLPLPGPGNRLQRPGLGGDGPLGREAGWPPWRSSSSPRGWGPPWTSRSPDAGTCSSSARGAPGPSTSCPRMPCPPSSPSGGATPSRSWAP